MSEPRADWGDERLGAAFHVRAARLASLSPGLADDVRQLTKGDRGPRRRPFLLSAVPLVGLVVSVAIALAVWPPQQSLTGPAGSPGSSDRMGTLGSDMASASAMGTTSPTSSVAQASHEITNPGGVLCGRLGPATCRSAIELVRTAHPADVARAWAIVVDDICPPRTACDRLYPFDSLVVLVPEPRSRDRHVFEVVGLGEQPERVLPSAAPIPPFLEAVIQALR
jgi:hypothetical protein